VRLEALQASTATVQTSVCDTGDYPCVVCTHRHININFDTRFLQSIQCRQGEIRPLHTHTHTHGCASNRVHDYDQSQTHILQKHSVQRVLTTTSHAENDMRACKERKERHPSGILNHMHMHHARQNSVNLVRREQNYKQCYCVHTRTHEHTTPTHPRTHAHSSCATPAPGAAHHHCRHRF
jgi:hypothetical protein